VILWIKKRGQRNRRKKGYREKKKKKRRSKRKENRWVRKTRGKREREVISQKEGAQLVCKKGSKRGKLSLICKKRESPWREGEVTWSKGNQEVAKLRKGLDRS